MMGHSTAPVPFHIPGEITVGTVESASLDCAQYFGLEGRTLAAIDKPYSLWERDDGRYDVQFVGRGWFTFTPGGES